MKGDIIHVVDHTQQTVRESNEGSSQQKEEVILVQTHPSGTFSAENKLGKLDYGWSMYSSTR